MTNDEQRSPQEWAERKRARKKRRDSRPLTDEELAQLREEYPPISELAPIYELQRPLYPDEGGWNLGVDVVCEHCPRSVAFSLLYGSRDLPNEDEEFIAWEPRFYPNAWLDGDAPITDRTLGASRYTQTEEWCLDYWVVGSGFGPITRRVPFGWIEGKGLIIEWALEPDFLDPNKVRDAYQRGTLRGKYRLACPTCGARDSRSVVTQEWLEGRIYGVFDAWATANLPSPEYESPVVRPTVSLQRLAESVGTQRRKPK